MSDPKEKSNVRKTFFGTYRKRASDMWLPIFGWQPYTYEEYTPKYPRLHRVWVKTKEGVCLVAGVSVGTAVILTPGIVVSHLYRKWK